MLNDDTFQFYKTVTNGNGQYGEFGELSRAREDAAFYRHLVENMPGLVCTFLPDGTLTYVNAAYCRYFNRRRKELVGRRFLDFLPDDATRKAAVAQYRSLTPDRPTAAFEHTVLAPDGSVRWQRWTDRAVFNSEGRPLYYQAIGEDITERRYSEEQLRQMQKMECVGRLAAGVSHDFNNILMVIQGYLSFLTPERGLPERLVEPVDEIEQATDRAVGLVRQLLLFSRKQVMEPGLLDVNEVVVGLSKMLGRILGEDIVLELRCNKKLYEVHADAGMLEQVLMNLAVNARDAMPSGGRLDISTEGVSWDEEAVIRNPESRPGTFVCIEVSDSGCGMAPDMLGHIFEPFFTTKEKGKGTGLGLPTVHGIIKQHGGWIDVESSPREGTTFRIYLPADTRGETGPSEALPSAWNAGRGSETLLVVEDDRNVCRMVKQALERYGYTVLAAESGVEALMIWKTSGSHIDLLLTDLVLPGGLSGKELAERLVADRPGLKIIYSSGYSPDITHAAGIRKEGIRFLQKPYELSVLLQMVRDSVGSDVPG